MKSLCHHQPCPHYHDSSPWTQHIYYYLLYYITLLHPHTETIKDTPLSEYHLHFSLERQIRVCPGQLSNGQSYRVTSTSSTFNFLSVCLNISFIGFVIWRQNIQFPRTFWTFQADQQKHFAHIEVKSLV